MLNMLVNVYMWMNGDWNLVGRVSKNKLKEDWLIWVDKELLGLRENGFVVMGEGEERVMYMEVEYEKYMNKELLGWGECRSCGKLDWYICSQCCGNCV